MEVEKQWLRSSIYIILKSELKDHEKVIKIMQMFDSYEAMNELSDVARETFGLGDDF